MTELAGLRVCMLLFEDVLPDLRVWKEARSLVRAGAAVDVFALGPEGSASPSRESFDGFSVTQLPLRTPATRKVWRALQRYRRFHAALRSGSWDVYHCHDGATLPLGLALARPRQSSVVYDAHEFFADQFPEEFWPSRYRRLLSRVGPDYYCERLFVRRADRVITVSDGIARLLEQRYGLREAPEVVRNAAAYWSPDESERSLLRRRLPVPNDDIVAVFVGSIRPGRGIERAIEALAELPSLNLVLIGSADDDYLARLRSVADRVGAQPRLHLLGHHPYPAYLELAAGADVAVYLLGGEGTSLSYRFSLPNKLFEYVMARVPMVVGDAPEIAGLVTSTGVGVSVDVSKPAAVAQAIADVASNRERFADALETAAKSLCWEEESRHLIEVYESLPRTPLGGARSRRTGWFGLKRPVKWLAIRQPVNPIVTRALRHVLPAQRLQRLPVGGRRVRGVVNGREFVMLRPDRCTVAKELFWGRGSLPDPAEQMALTIFNDLTSEADVLLDIGAYTGLFVLACTATNPSLKAHAFEIFPDAFRLLFDNCVENDVLDRVTCHHSGIGIPGTSVLIPNRVRASSLPTSLSSRVRSADGVQVRFDSLDSVVNLIQPTARVTLKVDVEGTENSVFAFGQSFLAKFRPAILCEVLSSSLTAELQKLLAPHDYRFFNVSPSGLVPRDRIEGKYPQKDWLFTVDGRHPVDAYVR